LKTCTFWVKIEKQPFAYWGLAMYVRRHTWLGSCSCSGFMQIEIIYFTASLLYIFRRQSVFLSVLRSKV